MTAGASPHFSGLPISLEHTLPSVLSHVALRHGDAPFIVGEDGSRTSFAAFWQNVRKLARALIAKGVDHGDRVAIWAPNSPQWILAAAATQTVGAVLVPINTRFKGAEAAFTVGKTRARVLFTVRNFLGNDYAAMLQEAAGGIGQVSFVRDLTDLAHIVHIDDDGLDAWARDLASEAELDARIARVTPDSIADILFTSGTTGQPKGAMHAHGQALWMPAIWNQANDLRAGDRMAIVNPFFHSFGYRSGWVSALVAGTAVYPMATFDAEALLALIERESVTVLMGPPTIFQSLLEHPRF
jgi:HIP---CoA ligase